MSMSFSGIIIRLLIPFLFLASLLSVSVIGGYANNIEEEDLIALENAIMANSAATNIWNTVDANIGGLKWADLSVSIKKGYLLHPSYGFVPNGSLCGVVGP